MIQLRKSSDRGISKHHWLSSMHTFSFAEYNDPKQMGFGVLRVINEDRIQGGTGFSTHGHKHMEIISYVVEGALEHKDSLGNTSVILPGDVQRMSAGIGIRHSEYNKLSHQETHFLQIWILPESTDLEPSYAQKSFESSFQKNNLILVASREGKDGSITLHQDVNIYACKAELSGRCDISLGPNRALWLQLIRGIVQILGKSLEPGDGIAITKEESISIVWEKNSEFLVFDLPSK